MLKCDEAYKNFLKLDQAFDMAEAKAYLRARETGVPAHACEYEATLATEIERADRDVAEALNKLCDRQMKALHAELDALRSIGTSVRQAYSGSGRGDF
ncbi:pyrroloquinoline quinone (PQQ) biosynthesis protein C [Mycolicibacterium sp. BK634]|uniref:hypothetical protein n=1 Tax=Mycolicibacterium sp. BK634 TaxID=2587099 RepID=UPI00160BD0EA|nr:hypothetical protein [Mycolicibacterium sp. BK634]MBB3752422.1 pyrroloquinoline quinone (PQQ) biosynthesis protein C [Mycolicibacterium sp. BK634]